MSLKIVSDANIPFAEEMFSQFGVLELIPGHQIEPFSIRNADALLVRSVTRIDAELLRGSSIRFVGSATAGTDHVDLDFLDEAGITFANAPGGNADSVVEYVLSSIFTLSFIRRRPILGATLGVVGCGQVGGRLARRARRLGFRVLENDPPLERKALEDGREHNFLPLNAVLEESSLVSLHVPLNAVGIDRTLGLIGNGELDLIGSDAWLVNAARGGVINEKELLHRPKSAHPDALILDVWENEPLPDSGLLRLAAIATAHIAGYSRNAKWNSTRLVADAFVEHFELRERSGEVDPVVGKTRTLVTPATELTSRPEAYLHDLLVQMYPIMEDHKRTVALPDESKARAAEFRRLRGEYPHRYSFDRFRLKDDRLSADWRIRLRDGLGIQIQD